MQVLEKISIPVNLDERAALIEASNTCACLACSRRQSEIRMHAPAQKQCTAGCILSSSPQQCRALSSKVVSQYSSLLSPMAVDCVKKVLDPAQPKQ